MERKFPRIDPEIVKTLEKIYPLHEYSMDDKPETLAFRGGQRDVVQLLKKAAQDQGDIGSLEQRYKRKGD